MLFTFLASIKSQTYTNSNTVKIHQIVNIAAGTSTSLPK